MRYSIKNNKNRVRRGDKFKIISSKGLNGVKNGDIVYSDQNSNSGSFVVISILNDMSNSVKLGIHVKRVGATKEDIGDRLAELEKEKEDLNMRLEFIDNTSCDEIDERRYLNYMILKEIDKDSSSEEKEEVINELLERSFNEYQSS